MRQVFFSDITDVVFPFHDLTDVNRVLEFFHERFDSGGRDRHDQPDPHVERAIHLVARDLAGAFELKKQIRNRPAAGIDDRIQVWRERPLISQRRPRMSI